MHLPRPRCASRVGLSFSPVTFACNSSTPTPLHLIEKPHPGTGATLFVEALMLPATGEVIAVTSEGRDEEVRLVSAGTVHNTQLWQLELVA